MSEVGSHLPAEAPPALVTGDVRRTVFRLALPVLCEQFLSFLVEFYDTFLSGRIGPEATSAVGLAAYVGWLASILFGMVGIGATALVARHWGAGQHDEANQIANRAMALSVLLGLAAAGAIFALAPLFVAMLAMKAQAAQLLVGYLRLHAAGALVHCVTMIGAAVLRGVGDMRSPMLILGLVSVVNVVASTLLVFGWRMNAVVPFEIPGLEVYGIVAGTIVARTVGALIMLAALARGLSGLKLLRRELRIRGRQVGRILRVGTPAALDGLLMWTGHFTFLMIVARLDLGGRQSATFAAHIVGVQLEAMTYLPAIAWGAAAATMIGQALGAGRPDRAIQAGHEAVRQCSVLAALTMVGFLFGADALYRLMHRDPAVGAIGAGPFRMVALSEIPLVMSIVYVAALRGAGDTRFPMFATAVGVFGVRLPVAYVCGIMLRWGLWGAWLGMCLDIVTRAALMSFRFARGRWIATRV